MLKTLKKLKRISNEGVSPNTPKLGKPNRFDSVISISKYFGPRNGLRPIPGGFSWYVGGSPITVVLKYWAPPPGKMPPGLRKLSLVLSDGCPPRKRTGRT